MVVAHGGWQAVGQYPGLAGGGLVPEQLSPVPYASHYGPQGLAIGDLTGDGRPDIAIADYNNGLVVLVNGGPVPDADADPDGRAHADAHAHAEPDPVPTPTPHRRQPDTRPRSPAPTPTPTPTPRHGAVGPAARSRRRDRPRVASR